jgi:hypothetical protein
MNVARSIRSITATRKVALRTLHGEPKSQSAINVTRRYIRTSTTAEKKGLNAALRNQNQASNEHLYGMKPVDFTVVPSVSRSPPPPPPKPGFQKYFFPLTLLITGGITAYFYFNNENDSKDYWVAMQTGGVLPGTYDVDDDDDDDDDDDEEESI